MVRKLKDNLFLLSIVLLIDSSLLCYLILKRVKIIFLIVLGILAAFILLRLAKVIKKNILEYLNGPKRFCKGRGIEIGSCGKHMVKGSMLVDIVDNFSSANPYKVDYVCDAHHLPEIEDASLDYICASHVLEHLSNPIKAILEWMRILRPEGIIWLKIPDKGKTFDRKRERTTLYHLIEDYKNEVPTNDPTHIDDFNKNTAPPRDEKHPYIHNHVWIPDDIIELFSYISKNHKALDVIECRQNTMKNSQDFWIVAKKLHKVKG